MSNRHRLCFVTASEMTVRAFLINHIRDASEYYDICVITNTVNPGFLKDDFGINADVLAVRIERSISPWRDIMALFALWRIFRQQRFALVHSVTPKAGLLSAVAGCIARVPNRWHTFTGQVWATRTGFSRLLLKFMDRQNARCTTRSLADSRSQLDFLINEGVVASGKASVLAGGSISGVDTLRFKPDLQARMAVRSEHGIADDVPLCIYLGRLKKDKGILILAEAFAVVQAELPDAVLMYIGPDEELLESELKKLAGTAANNMRFISFTKSPERYLATADLFCLPSYREGFGSVVIEAAACGVPAIGANIYGVSDAIEEGETGLLVQAGSVDELASTMTELLSDSVKRERMGARARERVQQEFTSDVVTKALMLEYSKVLD